VLPDEIAAWQRALLSFVPPAGLEGGLSRQRFVTGSLRDFDTVAPYSAEARRQLAQPRPPARPAEPSRP
jgi:hypothetical protein